MGGRGERERTGERIIRRGVGRNREWEGGGERGLVKGRWAIGREMKGELV